MPPSDVTKVLLVTTGNDADDNCKVPPPRKAVSVFVYLKVDSSRMPPAWMVRSRFVVATSAVSVTVLSWRIYTTSLLPGIVVTGPVVPPASKVQVFGSFQFPD